MNRTPIAEVNAYQEKASDAARCFLDEERLCLKRYEQKLKHYNKYFDLFEQKARHKLGLILTPIAHLAAIIWEGIIIQPLCYEWLEGVVSPALQLPASLLPACMLYGMSLCIGHQLHQVSIEKHEIQPGRFHFHQLGALAIAAILAVGYVGFLYLLVKLANDLLGENLLINQLIVYLGFFELALGFFAILGWEVIIAYLKQSLLKVQCRWSEKRLLTLKKRCNENHHYFLQGLCNLDERSKKAFQNLHIDENIGIVTESYGRMNHNQPG
jgi:hypothetical protein